MYVLDVNRNIINLADKDIIIVKNNPIGLYEYSVVARSAAYSATLHSGAKKDCYTYMERLIDFLDVVLVPYVTSTKRQSNDP